MSPFVRLCRHYGKIAKHKSIFAIAISEQSIELGDPSTLKLLDYTMSNWRGSGWGSYFGGGNSGGKGGGKGKTDKGGKGGGKGGNFSFQAPNQYPSYQPPGMGYDTGNLANSGNLANTGNLIWRMHSVSLGATIWAARTTKDNMVAMAWQTFQQMRAQ